MTPTSFPALAIAAIMVVAVSWDHSWRCVVRATDYEFPRTSRPEEGLDVNKDNDNNSDAPIRSLAFGSCHKLKYAQGRLAASNLWESVLSAANSSAPPDAWIWTGDAVYPPSKGIAPLDELEDEYQKMKSSPNYAAFVKRVPRVLGTYDDHDYGGNDFGKHMPSKRDRANLFYDFLGIDKPKDGREGVFYSATWGRPPTQLKLIVLDTRYYRDDHCLVASWATKLPALGAGIAAAVRWIVAGIAPARWCDGGRTVLGDEQWSWLERELRESQAALHVVVSSIQLLTTNPAMESWGQFPSEQRRLLDLLAPKRPGLVVLSGDVHHAEILNVSGIVEVTSSGLTHDCSSPIYGFLCEPILNTFASNRRSTSDFYAGRNFGRISIDWSARSMAVNVYALSYKGSRDSAERSVTELPSRPVLSTGDVYFGNDSDHVPPFQASELAPCMDGHLQTRFASILLALLIASCLAWYQGVARRRSKG